jgi:hypothetical protein
MMANVEKPQGFFQGCKATGRECRQLLKSGGFKAVVRRFGWKLFVAIFIYYIVRDFLIYIAIPYLIAKHVLN